MYVPKGSKKPGSSSKYAYEFRFPDKYHEKITFVEYKSLMGEFSKRSINAAMAMVQSGETLAEEETSLGSGAWVEYGDRSRDLSRFEIPEGVPGLRMMREPRDELRWLPMTWLVWAWLYVDQ